MDDGTARRVEWVRLSRSSSHYLLRHSRDRGPATGAGRTPSEGDRVVWRDAASGREIVRTPVLDAGHNGSIVTPGFGGRFYYMALDQGTVIELTPVQKKS